MKADNEWVLDEVKRLSKEEMVEVMIACGALLDLLDYKPSPSPEGENDARS